MRRLGAQLPSPTGDVVRGHMAEALAHQRRDNQGSWNWSVGIYRHWGVHFIRSGYADTSQEAADLANSALPEVIGEAAAYDEREAALDAILHAARQPEGEWVVPLLPIEGRDERFLRSLQWRVGQAGKNDWPGYRALAAGLREYLGS